MDDNGLHNVLAELRREWEQDDREIDALDAKCRESQQKVIDAGNLCTNAMNVASWVTGITGLGLAISGENGLALLFASTATISYGLQRVFSGITMAHTESIKQPPQYNM